MSQLTFTLWFVMIAMLYEPQVMWLGDDRYFLCYKSQFFVSFIYFIRSLMNSIHGQVFVSFVFKLKDKFPLGDH